MTPTVTATISNFSANLVQAILAVGVTILGIGLLSLIARRAARNRAIAEGRDGDKAQQEAELLTKIVLGLIGLAGLCLYFISR